MIKLLANVSSDRFLLFLGGLLVMIAGSVISMFNLETGWIVIGIGAYAVILTLLLITLRWHE